MKLDQLTNTEILFLYFSNKISVDKYTDLLENRKHRIIIPIFDLGTVEVNSDASDDAVEEILNSEHYKHTMDIHEKLLPIADLIFDADPELYDQISDILNKD